MAFIPAMRPACARVLAPTSISQLSAQVAALTDKEKYVQALKLVEVQQSGAVTITEKRELKYLWADVQYVWGVNCNYHENYPLALWHMQLALPVDVRSRPDHAFYDWRDIAGVYQSLGQENRAFQAHHQELEQARNERNTEHEVAALSAIGGDEQSEGRHREALRWFYTALRLERRSGGKLPTTDTLNSMGDSYLVLNRVAQGMACFNLAIRQNLRVNDWSSAAETVIHLAQWSQHDGDKDGALWFYKSALDWTRRGGKAEALLQCLTTFADAAGTLDRADLEMSAYWQMLPLQHNAGDLGAEADTLHNLAALYLKTKQRGAALGCYQRELSLRHQAGNRDGEAAAAEMVGMCYALLDQPAAAVPYYERAATLYRAGGDLDGLAETWRGLAGADLSQDRSEEALAKLRSALLIYRRQHDDAAAADVLSDLKEVEGALK